MRTVRVAVVVDPPRATGSIGMLLDTLERSLDILLTTLIVPAATAAGGQDKRQPGRMLTQRLAGSILFLETHALLACSRLNGRLARRTAGLRAGQHDLRSRFPQVIELSDGGLGALETKPDVVLILGDWLPAALSNCPPDTRLIQLGLGDFGTEGLALAGFEESNAGADRTAIRLYRIRRGDLSRQLLIDGRNRTKPLFSLNQAACWQRASAVLQQHLVNDGIGIETAPTWDATRPVAPAYTGTGTGVAARLLAYPARMLLRGMRFAARHARGKRRWRVAIYSPGPSWSLSGEAMPMEAAPAGCYYADPMLYRDPSTGLAYCFVEEFDAATGRGHIAVLQESANAWKRLGVALREPFHLSFPFLFSHGDELYMCPESGASGQIVAYRCRGFPLQWEKSAVLMHGVSATDTMIFPHAGRWWMLTNLDLAECPDHQSELHVFHAASPLSSEWQKLPGNPVKFDCRGARNGGMKVVAGRIFRFGQVQSFDAYGHGLNVYEVTRLDTGGYEEQLVQEIAPPAGSGAVGIHTYSSIDGRVAVDLLGKPTASAGDT